MKIEETFTVPFPLEAVYRFFRTEIESVARAIPGLEEFEDLGDDRYRVRVTQSVGSMGATFDLKAQLDDTEPMRSFRFSAVGRSVKGAVGDLRSKNYLELGEVSEGTRLRLESDLFLGGLLGSLGNRVVTMKSRQVVGEFVTNVSGVISDWMSSAKTGTA
jgi:carbon monoxide dehydrogenase subunit G